MKFGAHVSIANHLYDAVDRAVAFGCEAMQIFPGNPRGWRPGHFETGQVAEFSLRREKAGISPLVIHLPYLVNLAAPVERVYEASIETLADVLEKARAVEADFLVVHTGSHGGAGREQGLARIKTALKRLLEHDFGSSRLLLENTAGAGHTLGAQLEDIGELVASVDSDPRIGLCFDTCHAFAAGYDLASSEGVDACLGEIDSSIGLERLLLVHANDCKGALGSRSDRHEHIGKGTIGMNGFRAILGHPAMRDMTFVIETPRPDPEDDIRNLEVLKKLREEIIQGT